MAEPTAWAPALAAWSFRVPASTCPPLWMIFVMIETSVPVADAHCMTEKPCLFSAIMHAVWTSARSAYLDLKCVLLDSLTARLNSFWASQNASANWMNMDLDGGTIVNSLVVTGPNFRPSRLAPMYPL